MRTTEVDATSDRSRGKGWGVGDMKVRETDRRREEGERNREDRATQACSKYLLGHRVCKPTT